MNIYIGDIVDIYIISIFKSDYVFYNSMCRPIKCLSIYMYMCVYDV